MVDTAGKYLNFRDQACILYFMYMGGCISIIVWSLRISRKQTQILNKREVSHREERSP